jgi:hypothetical protein
VVTQPLHLVGGQEPTDDDEAVPSVGVDLFRRGLHVTLIILPG